MQPSVVSYLSVFTNAADSPVPMIATWIMVVLGGSLVLCACAVNFDLSKKVWGRRIWITLSALIAGSVLALLACGIATSITAKNNEPVRQEQVNHMADNLKEKYNANLIDPRTVVYENNELISGTAFTLSFPDGREGRYNIKWDKDTSEPTIMEKNEPPTPHELNQNANK